jgi:hypothetical protein
MSRCLSVWISHGRGEGMEKIGIESCTKWPGLGNQKIDQTYNSTIHTSGFHFPIPCKKGQT